MNINGVKNWINIKNQSFRLDILRIFSIAATYFFAHRIAFFFPDSESVIMMIWPAGGIGLAAFLLNQKRLWPALTIAFYIAGISADVFLAKRSLSSSFGYMTANMIESIGSAWLILKWSKDFNYFSKLKEILALIVGTVFINALSTCVGAGTSVITRGASFLESWQSWYIADGLGILVVAPFIIAWFNFKNLKNRFLSKKTIEMVIFLCIWIVFNILIFNLKFISNQISPHPYILVALLAWPAIRFGQRGVTLALMVMYGIAIVSPAIVDGPSPFSSNLIDSTHRLIELQLFLGFMSVVGYLLAAGYSDLMRSETALKNSEEKFKQLAENTSEVFWLRTETEMIYINPAFEKIFGIPCEKIYENPQIFTDVIHPDDKPAVLAILQSTDFKEKGLFNYDYRIIRPDKKIRWINAKSTPIFDENGKIIKRVGVAIDITSKKESEFEIIKSKEKAEESDRLKTAFLQNMSHEIRTPMNAIIGFSKLLEKPDLAIEKRKSFISIIVNSTNQLLSIVTDILTISSLETKQEKVNITKVCINNIIVDLFSIFKNQASNQNISLYVKQQLTDTQSEIYTDKTKVTQMLTNLITNALKFTHEGFIEFGYTLRQAQGAVSSVSEPVELAEMEFYVKDTGIGIKPEFHEKIFERFRQADKSINKLYGGTGLGLAISKAFAELLGGKIWVQSEPEKGSTFYFTIPYKPVYETDETISLTKQKENYKTILVAEDEEYNFLYIEELLINLDIKLIHTKDGRETLTICKENPNIDLILMDIKMPIMDGHEAAKLIKQFRPELPIIAQSAYALEHERAKYDAIFDDYLTKPISEKDLIQKVNKYLMFS